VDFLNKFQSDERGNARILQNDSNQIDPVSTARLEAILNTIVQIRSVSFVVPIITPHCVTV
jgi:hypothetical protein